MQIIGIFGRWQLLLGPTAWYIARRFARDVLKNINSLTALGVDIKIINGKDYQIPQGIELLNASKISQTLRSFTCNNRHADIRVH